MTDFETHPVGTAARIEQLEAENKRLGDLYDDTCYYHTPDGRAQFHARKIVALETQATELGNFLAAYMAEAFTAGRTVKELTEALTRANAATAAAFEVAAKAVTEAHVFADDDTDGETAAKVIALGRAGKAIRAIATPDQTAAMDKLIAEAVKPYVALLKRWQGLGCPNCNGDCSHANPPIYSCIMQETHASILDASKKGGA